MRVAAVAVTYFPDASVAPRLLALAEHVEGLIVVDNGSGEAADGVLQTLERAGVHVIRNTGNRGLAAALNQGVRAAFRQGLEWALLADQDSEIDAHLLEHYRPVIQEQPAGSIAVIGNNYANRVGNVQLPLTPVSPEGPAYQPAKAVITAGSLISLTHFQQLGGFREDFFIDWVDTEYCYRARRQGLQVWIVQKTLVYQRIGQTQAIDLSWGTAYASNHAARRRYYMMRNLILLMKDYFFFEPAWFAGRFADLIKATVKIIGFETDKALKLRALARGFYDGLSGQSRYAVE